MTLAVFRKNKGQEGKRFTDALLAARSTLVRIKYAAPPKEGPLAAFKLTAAGMKVNRKHENDRAKHLQFDRLFLRYRADIEVQQIRDSGEDSEDLQAKDQVDS